jgi:MoaA/NifB/PqqE/SkfB family radical SAM enzyme
MTKLKVDFIDWLRDKSSFEYWNGEISDVDSAINLRKRFLEQAFRKELFPKTVTLFLTNRCNLLCEHCGQNSSKALPDELSLTEILNLIPRLLELRVKYVSFSGGEPFLREDIFEIIRAFKNNGFIVGVISNGLISNQKLLDKIADSDLDSINVSIDGLKETHNAIRKNPKSFDLAMKFLLFASTQTRASMTSVTTCVSPNSLPELEDLCEAVFSHGARSWVLRPISPTGRAAFNHHLFLSDDELKSFIDFCVGKVQKGI